LAIGLLWSFETLWSTAFRVSKESHSGLASQPLRKIRRGKLQKTIDRLRKCGIEVPIRPAWLKPSSGKRSNEALFRVVARRLTTPATRTRVDLRVMPLLLHWRKRASQPKNFSGELAQSSDTESARWAFLSSSSRSMPGGRLSARSRVSLANDARRSRRGAICTNVFIFFHLIMALAIGSEASPLFPEISSDRQVRPRADERDRTWGVRTFGCRSRTGHV
jgi:hypothetical protein